MSLTGNTLPQLFSADLYVIEEVGRGAPVLSLCGLEVRGGAKAAVRPMKTPKCQYLPRPPDSAV